MGGRCDKHFTVVIEQRGWYSGSSLASSSYGQGFESFRNRRYKTFPYSFAYFDHTLRVINEYLITLPRELSIIKHLGA